MSNMLDRWFPVPQQLMRSGKIKKLSGMALKVYLALLHDCERYQNRKLTRTTKQLQDVVGGSRNSHKTARVELTNLGLIVAKNAGVEGFVIEICDAATGKPYELDSKISARLSRKPAPEELVPEDMEGFTHGSPANESSHSGTDFNFGENLKQTNRTPWDAVPELSGITADYSPFSQSSKRAT